MNVLVSRGFTLAMGAPWIGVENVVSKRVSDRRMSPGAAFILASQELNPSIVSRRTPPILPDLSSTTPTCVVPVKVSFVCGSLIGLFLS